MSKHHVIISGTGRAGTTFLIQLFTILGFETGFTDVTSSIFSNCNAGMEQDIRDVDAPYIIKSPWLCDYLDEVLESTDIVVDHAFIPVRDLYSAAESRREVTRTTDNGFYDGEIPGGLWHTEDPGQQESVLAHQLYKLIYTIAKRDIPMTLLQFPRLVHDPEYLYRKLSSALPEITYARFLEGFQHIAKPHLVHSFAAKDPAEMFPT